MAFAQPSGFLLGCLSFVEMDSDLSWTLDPCMPPNWYVRMVLNYKFHCHLSLPRMVDTHTHTVDLVTTSIFDGDL